MNRALVLVHGRSQQDKDSVGLKADWIAALRRGLAKTGRELPIPESDIRFPYYGQALADLVAGVAREQAADVILRGAGGDDDELAMTVKIVQEIRRAAGVTDAEIIEQIEPDYIGRGPLNWPWVRAALIALDRHVPGGSSGAVATVTRDVHHYLHRQGVRDKIETGVRAAMRPGQPTVVVGHSLGSIVAYNLLRREGQSLGWDVPLFVTLGSPLAVTAVKQSLAPLDHPTCVGHWFNAMDDRDFVSLYPLDARHFPIEPAVENKTDLRNHTDNRHGIDGYLDDEAVAARIHDALSAAPAVPGGQ